MSKKELTEEELKKAYNNYADSHWSPPEDPEGKTGLIAPQLWGLVPMQHSFESFSEECKRNKRFYKKYTNEYPSLY
jgi:hypothetical protein